MYVSEVTFLLAAAGKTIDRDDAQYLIYTNIHHTASAEHQPFIPSALFSFHMNIHLKTTTIIYTHYKL